MLMAKVAQIPVTKMEKGGGGGRDKTGYSTQWAHFFLLSQIKVARYLYLDKACHRNSAILASNLSVTNPWKSKSMIWAICAYKTQDEQTQSLK